MIISCVYLSLREQRVRRERVSGGKGGQKRKKAVIESLAEDAVVSCGMR